MASATAIQGSYCAEIHAPSTTHVRASLPALSGIRFFAAIYVVFFHALPWLAAHFALPAPLRTFLSNGYVAVALFFLLSGFILAYTYEGHVENRRDRITFWEARFARIYPVYFLSLLLALPYCKGLTLPAKFSVLAMAQAWIPWHPEWTGAWNYPAWSLSFEAFFYLCFPFIQRILSRLGDRALACCVMMAGSVCIFAHTPTQVLGNWDYASFCARFFPHPLLRIPEFILGMALGNWFLRHGAIYRSPMVTLLAVLAVLFLLSAPIQSWVSLVVVPFSLLIYDLADQRNWVGALFSNRLMLLLGGASYSIYLLQAPFRDWIRTLSAHAPSLLRELATPASPALLVLFSILVFKLWEEPWRRFFRRHSGAIRASS